MPQGLGSGHCYLIPEQFPTQMKEVLQQTECIMVSFLLLIRSGEGYTSSGMGHEIQTEKADGLRPDSVLPTSARMLV